jgi:hypothetical protein
MASKTEQAPKAGHPKIVAVLIGFATVFAFVAVFSIWANRQALNTDNWVNTSEKILQNKKVQERLSDYVATEVFAHVDVQEELAKNLPPQLQPLAGPAAAGISQLAPQITERALATAQVQELWGEANRAAHEALLEVLDGGGENLSTENGDVVLDLSGLLTKVSSQLGAGEGLAEKLPADAGKLTILHSDELSTAQSIAQLIRKLPIVLTLLAVGLFGLAIFLAGPRRRQALRAAGLGFVAAGALALIVRGFAGSALVDALAANEAAKPAAEAVWSIGTSLLVTVAVSAIAFGLLVFIGAWLAGPTRWATRVRREAAPHVREQPGASVVAAIAVWVALIAWAPVAAFHKPLGILLFALLFAAGAEILRRQMLREFPASPGSVAAAGPGDPEAGRTDALAKLEGLRDEGVLTQEQYESERERLTQGIR